MARRLKMAEINTIRTLHASGHSNREISRLTGIHRATVGKYISEGDSKPAKPDHRVQPGPTNACEPFRALILEKLEQGLEGTRIFQDLRDGHGFTASYSSVRRFIQRLRKRTELPVRRIETAPGEEAQIDFGTGAPLTDASGKKRRPWLFRMVLSHSRKGYSEAVLRQTTDNFIGAMENAFHAFGGAPKRLVIDNLKAAVARADWYDPEVHPKLQSFANHYGTTILPAKPYKPEHKGKIENGVKYAKNNGLKGRSFDSLSAQNEFLLDWETRIADKRIHGTTKKQVARLFEEVEQAALNPLPADRFPLFQEGRRTVHRDGHLEVDKAYYSAPPEYVGRRLWVRWDLRLVRIFDDRWNQIVVHAKVDAGRFCTDIRHIPREKFSAVERGADALLKEIAWIGPHTSQWANATVQSRGVEAVRVLVGLKALAKKHSAESLENACRVGLAHSAYRLRTIRQLLAKSACEEQQQFDFIEHHPIIRPLSNYSLESLHQFRKDRSLEISAS